MKKQASNCVLWLSTVTFLLVIHSTGVNCTHTNCEFEMLEMNVVIIIMYINIELYSAEMKNGYQWRKVKTAFCSDRVLVNCD